MAFFRLPSFFLPKYTFTVRLLLLISNQMKSEPAGNFPKNICFFVLAAQRQTPADDVQNVFYVHFCFSFAKIFRAGWGERRFSEYRPFSRC